MGLPFDSCWKCARTDPASDRGIPEAPKGRRAEFFVYWRRGWLVLLMSLCLGLSLNAASYALAALRKEHEALGLVLALALLFLAMPAAAYWIFVLFFGADAWPLPAADVELPKEDQAFALLREAGRLEARFQVREALDAYQQVIERFGGTEAARDAQRSMASLCARTGHPYPSP
jgi:hypothetical protein